MAGLEGVKVVELTQYAAGPAAGRALAEMGATVIKVEPFTGDEQRTQGMAWGMAFRTEFDDVAYDCGSFNKEWTAINAKNPECTNCSKPQTSSLPLYVPAHCSVWVLIMKPCTRSSLVWFGHRIVVMASMVL